MSPVVERIPKAATAVRGITSVMPSRAKASREIQGALRSARRLVRSTRHSVEDLVDDAAHQIKHYPLRSIAVAFGAGTAVGLLMFRNGKK
jgi:ElaB/YqjD/DUF883 family membrane-anchored ribosome-binding protein